MQEMPLVVTAASGIDVRVLQAADRERPHVLGVLAVTVFMAAAAAIVPARRVGSVDPAVAFKG